MSRKKLECFIMMFGQIVNLKHIICMMDLNAELLLYLQKYKIIPTSLFNVFRRSRGSSLRLASIKSAYLSDNNSKNKNSTSSLSQLHLYAIAGQDVPVHPAGLLSLLCTGSLFWAGHCSRNSLLSFPWSSTSKTAPNEPQPYMK